LAVKKWAHRKGQLPTCINMTSAYGLKGTNGFRSNRHQDEWSRFLAPDHCFCGH
jgi:hypothetical protein